MTWRGTPAIVPQKNYNRNDTVKRIQLFPIDLSFTPVGHANLTIRCPPFSRKRRFGSQMRISTLP